MTMETLREGRNFLVRERLELVKKLDYYDKEIAKICHQIETLEFERKRKHASFCKTSL